MLHTNVIYWSEIFETKTVEVGTLLSFFCGTLGGLMRGGSKCYYIEEHRKKGDKSSHRTIRHSPSWWGPICMAAT